MDTVTLEALDAKIWVLFLLRKCPDKESSPQKKLKLGNSTSNCPGSNSQCCPTPPQLKSDASIGYDDNPFVPGEAAASDITGSGDPGIGNPDEDIAFGMDTPPEGSLNPDDWPAVPLDSENLFLSSDDTDNYGLVAGLEDSMGEGFDHTG